MVVVQKKWGNAGAELRVDQRKKDNECNGTGGTGHSSQLRKKGEGEESKEAVRLQK